jgi:LCP family protein required for cell wall assembly
VVTAIVVWAMATIAVGVSGSWYVRRALDRIEAVDVKTANLPTESVGATGPTVIENYLLVGSDSREGADPDDADFGGIGSAGKTLGLRSDTMLIMRYDPGTKSSSLLSVPRDLWVTIADTGKKDRVNEAFDRVDATERSQNMIDTISRHLGVPIHHYVEVNFAGFKKLVDSIGGINVYVETPVRDKHTGLLIEEPGCTLLDGVQARQYVRSRFLERFVNGKWRVDGTSDFGRMERQRDFLRRAINQSLSQVSKDPAAAGSIVKALEGSIIRDSDLDILGLANQMRSIGSSEVAGYSLAVTPATISGNSVLELDDQGSRAVLGFFRGTDPPPAVTPAPASPVAPVVIAAPQLVAQAEPEPVNC